MALFNREFNDSHDKVVLFGCFMAGLITIVILRGGWFGADVVGEISFLDYLATSIVVGIIVFYCVYIIASKSRSGVSIDTASDNAYYLGLLFTLLALSVSLLKMLNATSMDNPLAVNSALLPDFGLALFSTIAGILARIFLQQIRPEVADIEEDVAKELAKLTQALQGTVQNLVGNLDGLSKQTEISMLAMIKRSDEMASNVTGQVSSLIVQAVTKNEAALSGVAESVSKLGELTAQQIEKMVSTSDVFAESIANMGQAFEGFRSLSESIQSTVSKQTELTTKLVSAADSIEGSFNKLETNKLFSTVQDAVGDFEKVAGRMNDLHLSMGEIHSYLTNSSDSIQRFESTIAKKETELESLIDGHLMSSGKAIEKFESTIVKKETELESLIDGRLASSDNAIQKFESTIANKGSRIENLTKDAEGAGIDYVNALADASKFLRGKNK